jgi:hypothetical protein
MIARLFPLKISFPTRLTVPWPNYLDDLLKHYYMRPLKDVLFNDAVIMRMLRDRTYR